MILHRELLEAGKSRKQLAAIFAKMNGEGGKGPLTPGDMRTMAKLGVPKPGDVRSRLNTNAKDKASLASAGKGALQKVRNAAVRQALPAGALKKFGHQDINPKTLGTGAGGLSLGVKALRLKNSGKAPADASAIKLKALKRVSSLVKGAKLKRGESMSAETASALHTLGQAGNKDALHALMQKQKGRELVSAVRNALHAQSRTLSHRTGFNTKVTNKAIRLAQVAQASANAAKLAKQGFASEISSSYRATQASYQAGQQAGQQVASKIPAENMVVKQRRGV